MFFQKGIKTFIGKIVFGKGMRNSLGYNFFLLHAWVWKLHQVTVAFTIDSRSKFFY